MLVSAKVDEALSTHLLVHSLPFPFARVGASQRCATKAHDAVILAGSQRTTIWHGRKSRWLCTKAWLQFTAWTWCCAGALGKHNVLNESITRQLNVTLRCVGLRRDRIWLRDRSITATTELLAVADGPGFVVNIEPFGCFEALLFRGDRNATVTHIHCSEIQRNHI
jgi:hypothetical protein